MTHTGSVAQRDTGTEFRRELAASLRVDSVRCSSKAGSGHPTSSMSAADLLAVLLDGHLRLDVDRPRKPENDHLVFSKGHASPLYYAVLKAAGVITDEELLTFRTFGSRLEGHPTPRLPPTDVATGSLGQGLPIGVGLALGAGELDGLPCRTWVLCGDSELAEGSIWEAFAYASWRRLARLTAIVDVNRLGQTRETMLGWDTETYAARARTFGWHAIAVDGHDLDAIEDAYAEAERTTDRPTAIFARTRKGFGVAEVEDKEGKHGKPLSDADSAVAELGGRRDTTVTLRAPDSADAASRAEPASRTTELRLPHWAVGERVATRAAYGTALAALGHARADVVALDGEVSNSTKSEEFAAEHPERYFEMFIAEQQLVGAAVGLQVRGRLPYVSTFAAFLSRAYDFVRMAAVSRARLCLVGSHAGVAIGEDGPSQMGLEDMASLRAIHDSVVLHPSDANQTAQLVAALAEHGDTAGIGYLRTLRGATEVRTSPTETVTIGGSRLVRSSDSDTVTLVGAGTTVGECERAADRLAEHGVHARVLDCYSVKPIDVATLRDAAHETGLVVTVEDHRPEGGLGDAVLDALADDERRAPVRKLAVRGMPGSGTPEQLLAQADIDADAIVRAVTAGG